MNDDEILILSGNDVQSLLEDQEQQIIERVQQAYTCHASGDTHLPHSTFLRFPKDPANRIIGLPAYLGGSFEVAGMKWIASFPGNLSRGIDRASALLVLNSLCTGRPETLLESSIISAKRTAASAALAAKYMCPNRNIECLGVIGCGVINFEIVRFLRQVYPSLKKLAVYDLSSDNASCFGDRCLADFGFDDVQILPSLDSVLASSSLITVATTAKRPHITNISHCPRGATLLHVSLRDFAPEIILAADNIVDDADHVCRAETSLDLAQQLIGHRAFIQGTLADLFLNNVVLDGCSRPRIFSPFGLGILDLAVGSLVRELALQQHKGLLFPSFFPESWVRRELAVPATSSAEQTGKQP